MKINQVAAQLYTVRDFAKNPADIAKTLKKIRAIGYEAVQVSGVGPIDPTELGRMIKGEGLVCCATHEGDILTNAAGVAEKLTKLDCAYTAYPYPGGISFDTVESVKALAKKLDESGKILAAAGKVLTYHNHHIEFRKVEGQVALDIIYGETNPKYLQGEIDTYWVQFGGGDPVAWCEKLRKRLPLLHMKDYGVNAQSQVVYTEIGRGNLDWKRIVKAAEKSGCKWFIVEQDTCPADPFESLGVSFQYIKETLCS
jgi:sugar phosphate isomerase/epimerase